MNDPNVIVYSQVMIQLCLWRNTANCVTSLPRMAIGVANRMSNSVTSTATSTTSAILTSSGNGSVINNAIPIAAPTKPNSSNHRYVVTATGVGPHGCIGRLFISSQAAIRHAARIGSQTNPAFWIQTAARSTRVGVAPKRTEEPEADCIGHHELHHAHAQVAQPGIQSQR